MPVLSKPEATERLAAAVEKARSAELPEIYTELFPEKEPVVATPSAADLARQIRCGLEAEEIVDLWNVVFPANRNVRYDEEDDEIHYDEETARYAQAD